MTLQDNPTPENLAAFLNIPPQKLGEFLNMLTSDELHEIFENMLPKGAGEKILASVTMDEWIKIEEKIQSSPTSIL